jgi:hexosaminidase
VIIPRPTTVIRHPGQFVLGSSAVPGVQPRAVEPGTELVGATPGAERVAALLAEYLPMVRVGSGDARIQLRLNGTPAGGPEGYRLDIRADAVTLSAAHPAGLRHGVQTLRQLLPRETAEADAPPDAWRWPCLTIEDAPRLPWRGVLLDVARHYMSLDFLYRFVDEIALHKLNVLHLHLTDDQGWRVEVDGWPRLTEVGAWRSETMVGPAGSTRFDGRRHGGFYTQAQLRALVRYADLRGVSVVPEIEMPGHARSVLAAYPRLGNHPGRRLPVWTSWGISEDILGVGDAALEFCREVLGQVVDVFPSRYVHVGGDECPTAQWEASVEARRRAADLGLAGPHRLHGWFLGEMGDFLAGLGRRAVCWDESGEDAGLPADMVVTAWRDPAHGAGAVARGHQVIMAPYRWTFLDYPASEGPDEPPGQPGHLLTLDDVYRYDPLGGLPPAYGDAPGVLGTQAQIWTEFAPTPAHVWRLAHPRLWALAETAWSSVPGDLADFRARLARRPSLPDGDSLPDGASLPNGTVARGARVGSG